MKIIPIEIIVLGFVAYIAEGTHAVYNNFYCYGWTQEDLDAMGPGRTVETQRYYCENNLGHVFTHGNNRDYPNCGTCWCCQRKVYNNFHCYGWTQEDLDAMGPGRTVETERHYCENNLGHVFTHGNNKDYPNCGTCWCCQRKVYNNFFCYGWTQDDLTAMGPGRTVETQRHYCENNLGHVFTHGNNKDHPNCGTCWCCQRKVYNNFYCYGWTQDDLTAMGPGRTVETQRRHC